MAMKHSEDNGPIPAAQTPLKPVLYIQYKLMEHLRLLHPLLTTVLIEFKVHKGKDRQVTNNSYQNDKYHITNMALRKHTGLFRFLEDSSELSLCLRLWGYCKEKSTVLDLRELINHHTETKMLDCGIYISS